MYCRLLSKLAFCIDDHDGDTNFVAVAGIISARKGESQSKYSNLAKSRPLKRTSSQANRLNGF